MIARFEQETIREPWRRWFAWWPIWDRWGQCYWLCVVERRRCIAPPWLSFPYSWWEIRR